MMPTAFHPGTMDLLALTYEPVATLPGLVVARYRTMPDRSSRHWRSLAPASRHRCGPAGALSERSEFLIMTALSKASYWCHSGNWRQPNISVPVDAAQLCEHSALPRLLARAMGRSIVRSRHLTVELTSRPDLPLAEVIATLQRLHELGVRLSYAPATALGEFDDFAFDERRVELGTQSVEATMLTGTAADETTSLRRPHLLATGVTTGDHLMAALTAHASHIDGAFAGTVRSDRSNAGDPGRFDDAYACM